MKRQPTLPVGQALQQLYDLTGKTPMVQRQSALMLGLSTLKLHGT